MDPRGLNILPFGILPLLILGAYVAWKLLSAAGQRTITNDRRFGDTEFPNEVATLLQGLNRDELAFSEDGKSLILTVQNAYRELATTEAAKEFLLDTLRNDREVNWCVAEQLQVSAVERTDQSGGYKVTLKMPAQAVVSTGYIESAIKNLGRVFIRNDVNEHRWLLMEKGEREVEVTNGRMFVRVERVQLVPTMTGNWREQVMSERQITRNIKNRLWNQVEVRCLSIDDRTYCGEIVLPIGVMLATLREDGISA